MKLSVYLIFSLIFPLTTHGALSDIKEIENLKIDQIKEINESNIVDLNAFVTSINKRIQQLEESIEKEKLIILQQEESIEKNLIYPFLITIFSAILGGLAGYFGIKKRSTEEIEKNKIDATNKVLLEALACFQTLIGIKSNYIERLTNNHNPLNRLFSIPPILMVFRHSNPEINKLGYLAKDKLNRPGFTGDSIS